MDGIADVGRLGAIDPRALPLRLQIQLRKKGGALNHRLGLRLEDTGRSDREIPIVGLRPGNEFGQLRAAELLPPVWLRPD